MRKEKKQKKSTTRQLFRVSGLSMLLTAFVLGVSTLLFLVWGFYNRFKFLQDDIAVYQKQVYNGWSSECALFKDIEVPPECTEESNTITKDELNTICEKIKKQKDSNYSVSKDQIEGIANTLQCLSHTSDNDELIKQLELTLVEVKKDQGRLKRRVDYYNEQVSKEIFRKAGYKQQKFETIE